MPEAVFAKLQGVWRSHAYGTLLEIGPAGYRLYEETSVSCLFVFEGTLEDLAAFFVDVEVSPRGRAFSARRAAGVTRVGFRRLQAMPRNCLEPDWEQMQDPLHNFDVLWHTFAERYALFDLRGVDWQASYERYRPRVQAGMGARRLFAIFVDMLRPLRDGHVELRASCGRFNAGDPLPLQRLVAELEGETDGLEVVDVIAGLRERVRAMIRERYLRSALRRSGNGLLEWGRIDEATGYLAIRAMAGQCGKVGHPHDDQKAVASAMERVMRDLGHLPSMVIDLRGNGGGYDGVALRLAGYFADRKRLAFSKAASKGERYGGKQAVYIEPRGKERYAGRIFLFTSALTASAAEIFVLALLNHPRITRIGEATQGMLSDAMERHLPNGWSMTLSNEVYRAVDGELYEDRGVPPHVELPFLDRRGIDPDRDPMLDHVLGRH